MFALICFTDVDGDHKSDWVWGGSWDGLRENVESLRDEIILSRGTVDVIEFGADDSGEKRNVIEFGTDLSREDFRGIAR